MPRPRRFPKPPKAKPEPITYAISDEITSVAATLFARFEVHYNDLRSFRIAYVMVQGGRAPARERIDGNWAGITREHAREKALHGYDLILWVREAIWRSLDSKQREALVAHQLDHYTTNDKGALVRQHHTVEDFQFVVRNWGAWHEHVEAFGRQLSLFGKPDPKGNGDADAFADLDQRMAAQRADREAGNVTQLRRPSTTTDHAQA